MRSDNPYQAPLTLATPPRRPSGRVVQWTGGILFGCLLLHIVVRIVAIAIDISADLLIIGLEGDVDYEQTRIDVQQAGDRFSLLTDLRRQTRFVLVLLWLLWASSCNRLARDRGLALYYGALGTIGWWFVPIANLVVPLRVTAEQWRASVNPEPGGWQTQPVSWVVVVWWFSLIAAVVLRVSVFAVAPDFMDADVNPYEGLQSFRRLLRRDVVQHGVAILAASLALVIVNQISNGLRRGLR